MTARETIEARLALDNRLGEARLELYEAAIFYYRMSREYLADDEYMVGVIARLETAAEKFVAAKQEGRPVTSRAAVA